MIPRRLGGRAELPLDLAARRRRPTHEIRTPPAGTAPLLQQEMETLDSKK